MRIEKGHKEEANVDKKRACEYQKRACLYHFPYLIALEVLMEFAKMTSVLARSTPCRRRVAPGDATYVLGNTPH